MYSAEVSYTSCISALLLFGKKASLMNTIQPSKLPFVPKGLFGSGNCSNIELPI